MCLSRCFRPGLVSAFALLHAAGGTPGLAQPPAARPALRKPSMDDTLRASVYADNWFVLYVNGEQVAVDSIAFLPHNVVSVDILPAYPMTIAVMARDNFDPRTGMEYANSQIGDGGLVLKFGDGTVTDGSWKARCVSRGPIGGDTKNPRVESEPIPPDWFAVGFDDAGWNRAKEYTEEEIGPKQPYYDADFSGATFIWSDDLKLDNVVLFRKVVSAPPDGRARTDFRGLNDVVPEGGARRPGGGPGGGRRPGQRPPAGAGGAAR
ncbi:MAG: hypothetical protein ACKOCW_04310 [Planctomycetaceae bacterium]